MIIEEVMTADPTVVTNETSVGEAWEALSSLEVRHLPVIDEQQELVGILSDRDFGSRPVPTIVADVAGRSTQMMFTPVVRIMTAKPISVDADADVRDVIGLMLENKIGAIPVVDPENHVVGIVSYLDILRRLEGIFSESDTIPPDTAA